MGIHCTEISRQVEIPPCPASGKLRRTAWRNGFYSRCWGHQIRVRYHQRWMQDWYERGWTDANAVIQAMKEQD